MMKDASKRITILDVATKSGMSKSTVSRVMRGDGDVSDAARQKVSRTAERLNYQPSVFARVLRSQRSFALGMVIPDIANPFFPEIVRSVQNVADERGYTVLLANSDWHVERERKYLDLARRYHLDGVIINPIGIPAAELVRLGCPVVVIGSREQYKAFDCVGSDTLGSIGQAIDYLVAQGHRDIVLIAGPARSSAASLRVNAFRLRMSHHHLPFGDDRILPAEFSCEGGLEAAFRIASLAPRPTAVVCGNDQIALGVLSGLRDISILVPEEISVIGIDNIEASAVAFPPLTTVGKDKAALGARAASVLIDRIEGRLTGAPIRELMPTTLVARASVGAPRASQN